MRENREKYLLYIIVGVALLPVLFLRDFTPSNELRYLSIADEALRNHTFFTFSNHGVLYADKPPLYLWAVMLCRWLTGTHCMWLFTLLSLVPALGIVRVMDVWTRQEMDGENRFLAQLILLTSGLFIGSAVTLRMDMLMCLFIVLALHAFWQILKGATDNRCYRWLFPICLFLALFTKGPLGLLIPLCSTTAFLALSGRIRQFFRYWNGLTWGILLICCALWFGAVYMEGGTDYLNNLLFHQTIDRAVNSFHHDGPFYYYLISIWYCMAPWSLLVIGAVVVSLRSRLVRSDLQVFFLTAGITTFTLLSCISSKLQIYFLPAIPFLVYGAMMFLSRFNLNGWIRAALAVPAGIFAIALPTLAVVNTWDIQIGLNGLPLYAAAVILSLCGIYTLYMLYKKKEKPQSMNGAVHYLGIGLLLAVFAGGWALAELNPSIGYGTLCEKASELSREWNITDFRTWHIPRSENMDAYLHHAVKIIPGDKQPVPDTGSPFLLLTHRRDLSLFPEYESVVVGPYAVIIVQEASPSLKERQNDYTDEQDM